MTDTDSSFKAGASRSIYYSLTDDVPGLTEEEKQKLEAVMIKAQEFEAEEENKMRQPTEGQLYKYTNVVKGWQYRWFVLTPDTGMFEYYMLDERKKSRPRGALHLAGAVVIPSDEDNQSFSVSAVCGEVYKLKASDAKERQFWVDRIRAVIEKCINEDSGIPLKGDLPASVSPPVFAFCKSNSTFHVSEEKPPASPSHAVSEKNISSLVAEKNISSLVAEKNISSLVAEKNISSLVAEKNISSLVAEKNISCLIEKPGEKWLSSMNEIKEAVYKAVTCQKTLAKSIENLPFSGPSVKCSDRRLLLIKATSQATVQSLEQCFLILHRLRQREVLHSMNVSAVTSYESLNKSKSNIKKVA